MVCGFLVSGEGATPYRPSGEVIEGGGMKPILLPPTSRRTRSTAAQRLRVLAEFDRSGLSGAGFARDRRIRYSTFCNWRRQRARSKRNDFAEVEIVPKAAPEPLVIEFGPHARLRIHSLAQLEMAASLIKHFQAPC